MTAILGLGASKQNKEYNPTFYNSASYINNFSFNSCLRGKNTNAKYSQFPQFLFPPFFKRMRVCLMLFVSCPFVSYQASASGVILTER